MQEAYDATDYSSDNRPEERSTRNCACCVLLEGVNVVVLDGVHDHDLADAVEWETGNACEPGCMVLDCPGEPTQCQY